MRVKKKSLYSSILIAFQFLVNLCITTKKERWTSRDSGSAEIYIQPGWDSAEAELNWNWTRKAVEERNNGIILWLMWFTGQKVFFSLLNCSWLLHVIKPMPMVQQPWAGRGLSFLWHSEPEVCLALSKCSSPVLLSSWKEMFQENEGFRCYCRYKLQCCLMRITGKAVTALRGP